MKPLFFAMRHFSLSLLFFTLSTPLAWAGPKPIGFKPVTKGLFRGGRPTNTEQMLFLREQGIKTIVNLQGEGLSILPGEKDSDIEKSEELAEREGLRYFNISVPVLDIGNKNESEDLRKTVLQAVRIMEDPQLTPVYVHCNVGADRTGVVIAAYRILHEGCSFEQAWREVKQRGIPLWTPLLLRGDVSFLHALAAHPESFGHARPSGNRCPLR